MKKTRIPSPHPRIRLYEVTYISDDMPVKGYLAIPDDHKTRPGLLYLRGGIKNVGMVRIQRMIQWASEGMVVFAPFYRGNKGGQGHEDFCGHDRNDAIAAYDVMNSMPEVDSGSIHIVGFSRGAVMALFTALARDEAKTVTCWSGVSDMVLTYEERIDLRRMMKRVIGGTPTKYPERFFWRTPLSRINQLVPRLLIIHGYVDQHVSVEHAYRLNNECLRHQKDVTFWLFPMFEHQFPLKAQQRTLTRAANWMRES